MSTITDVRWIIFGPESQNEIRITDSVTKDDLLNQMKSGLISAPAVKDHEELCLTYTVDVEPACISIVNLTSDVAEEHYRYALDEYVVVESIRDDIDYVFDYNSGKLCAENRGAIVTQEEYVTNRRK